MLKKYLLKLWILLSIVPLYSQQPIDGIAAVVGKEIILISDINTMITQYAMQNRVNPFQDQQLLNRLSKQILSRMVDEKLLLIKAEEDTIRADEDRVDQVVEQQLNGFLQQAGSQETLEQYYGMSMALIKKDLRKRIADQMVVEQLRNRRFAGINVSRREVEEFYKEFQDSLPRIEESVDLSHILMQIAPSEEARQIALEKIERIQQMLKEGQDFATLAEKYSEDPSAKANKGNLGWTSRGDFVREFEEAAYAMEIDQISDIVQTQFGFHIIQLINRQGDKINARHILIQLQPTAEDEQRVKQRLSEIRQKIIDGEATFQEMALQYSNDPNVQQDKGDLGEFQVNNFQVKAFAEAVKDLSEGQISEPVRTEFGYHIIRLNKRIPARYLTPEKDWQQIEQIATEFKRNKAFEKWLNELRDDIPVQIKIEI